MDPQYLLTSLSAMLPVSFIALWNDATFARLLQALPTALMGSLSMTFALLGVMLACLKWMMFLAILVATFLLGLGLLVVVVGVLMVMLMKVVMEGVDVQEPEQRIQDSDNDDEKEQGGQLPVARCTRDDISRKGEPEDGRKEDAKFSPQIQGMIMAEEVEKRLKELWMKTIAEMPEAPRHPLPTPITY